MPKVNSRNVDAPGRYQYHYNANMTDEQRAAATKKLDEMKKNGRVTIKNDGYGLSQSFMENILKEQIEAGNIVDKNDDGEEDIFTNMNKRNLGASFETTHKAKGYSTDFTHMKKGTSFEYTYDEMKNYIDKAGYKFKEPTAPKTPATPATPDPVAAPAVDDRNVQAPPEPPVTPAPVKEPKNDKLDTVILDATTYTDENGNVIADDTKASINGQPYHSKTGFNTFGTLTPDPVDWKQYSMKELDKLDAAPSGKKEATAPDTAPVPSASDKGATTVPQVEVPKTPITETPVTTDVKAQPPVDAKKDEAPTPVAVKEPVVPAPKAEEPVTTEVKPQPPVEAKKDEAPTPVAVKEPVTPAPKAEAPVTEEVKPQPAVEAKKDETPVVTESKTGQAKFEADLAADSELASADANQRVAILDQRTNNIQKQITNLTKPTVVIKKGFLGLGQAKTKVIKTAEENTAANKDQITALQQNLDNLQKLKVYAGAATHVGTMYASSSFVDDNGNKIAEYPQYTIVKYKNANGEEAYAARVENYNRETHKRDSSYYALDVQQIREVKGVDARWDVVPDMKNPLTDGQEIR